MKELIKAQQKGHETKLKQEFLDVRVLSIRKLRT